MIGVVTSVTKKRSSQGHAAGYSPEPLANLHVRLAGEKARQGRVSLEDLAILSSALQQSLERLAVRTMKGRSSLRPGPRPAEAKAHVQLFLNGLSKGSTILSFEVGSTQFDLEGRQLRSELVEEWVDGMRNVRAGGRPHPPEFDRGVLAALHPLSMLRTHGVERIEFEWSDDKRRVRAVYDELTSKRIETLLIPPAPNLRAIEGVILEADFHSPDITFMLYTPDGSMMRCAITDEDLGAVMGGLLRHVRVIGEAATDGETGQPRRMRVHTIETLGETELGALPFGSMREFWTGADLEELIQRQGVGAFDPDAGPSWDIPTSEEMGPFLAMIENKPRRGNQRIK